MRRSKDSPFNFESITSFLLGFLSEILPKLQADKKSKELSALAHENDDYGSHMCTPHDLTQYFVKIDVFSSV